MPVITNTDSLDTSAYQAYFTMFEPLVLSPFQKCAIKAIVDGVWDG